MLGVYLEVYSVFGYEPNQTEWGPRPRGPQMATMVSFSWWSQNSNTGRHLGRFREMLHLSTTKLFPEFAMAQFNIHEVIDFEKFAVYFHLIFNSSILRSGLTGHLDSSLKAWCIRKFRICCRIWSLLQLAVSVVQPQKKADFCRIDRHFKVTTCFMCCK